MSAARPGESAHIIRPLVRMFIVDLCAALRAEGRHSISVAELEDAVAVEEGE